MSKKTAVQQFSLEMIWWAFTLVLTALVLLPIYSYRVDFPFYVYNTAFLIVAITITRYIFSLHMNWIRDRFLLQGVLSFLMIPTAFLLGQGLNEYITYLDNNGPDALIRQLSAADGLRMSAYLNSEYFFFGIWSVIAAIVLPFRVIYRVWTRYKVKYQ